MMKAKETNEENIMEEDVEISSPSSVLHTKIPPIIKAIINKNKYLVPDSIINNKYIDVPEIQSVTRSSSPVRSIRCGHSIRNDKNNLKTFSR